MINIRKNQHLIIKISGWILILLLTYQAIIFLLDAAQRPSSGFVTYYTSSKLLVEGATPAHFYDRSWFQTQIERCAPTVKDIYHANPPTMSLMFLPLANFECKTSRIYWTIFNLIIIVLFGWWLGQAEKLKGVQAMGLVVFLLTFQPIYANFYDGQAYVLLLGLLAIAYYGYERNQAIALGLALALMLTLKTAGVLLWLLIMVQQRWKALIWGLIFVSGIILFSLPWLGLDAWKRYIQLLFELSSQPELSVTAYQTYLSFFRHLFTVDIQWSPAPIFVSPILGVWLPRIALISMIGISTYLAYHVRQSNVALASFIILNVILSPVSQDYHYTFLLIPIVLLTVWSWKHAPFSVQCSLVIAIILIAANLPYKSPQFAIGVWAIFAYPKLYGGFILWIISVWAMLKLMPNQNCHKST